MQNKGSIRLLGKGANEQLLQQRRQPHAFGFINGAPQCFHGYRLPRFKLMNLPLEMLLPVRANLKTVLTHLSKVQRHGDAEELLAHREIADEHGWLRTPHTCLNHLEDLLHRRFGERRIVCERRMAGELVAQRLVEQQLQGFTKVAGGGRLQRQGRVQRLKMLRRFQRVRRVQVFAASASQGVSHLRLRLQLTLQHIALVLQLRPGRGPIHFG